MKNMIVLLLGAAIGAASLFIFANLDVRTSSHDKFTIESRSLLVDSVIDALESIENGDTETSKIILSSAVDSQIIAIKKMKSSSSEERRRAEEWEKKMLEHKKIGSGS